MPNLSEQNLVDCVYRTDGCLGGLNPPAWYYVYTNGGIATELNYPYVSGKTGTVSIIFYELMKIIIMCTKNIILYYI